MCGIFSKLTMKTPKESQSFLMSPCQWGCSGGYSCTWICFNIYLSIIYFIWYMVRYTMKRAHVISNVTRNTKLQGGQRSPELAFRSTDFRVLKNLIFPALFIPKLIDSCNLQLTQMVLNFRCLVFCFFFKSKNEFTLEICKVGHWKKKRLVSWKVNLFCIIVLFRRLRMQNQWWNVKIFIKEQVMKPFF